MKKHFGTLLLIAVLGALVAGQAPDSTFANFEGAQTNPIRLSPDGTRLFAVNTADARLSVFDLANPSAPALIAEIPVGLEPVSVNARNNNEVWVVNQVSDSVSIVSVAKRTVIETLYMEDEPSDVVFAGGRAFVSVSRSNEIRVIDVATRQQIQTIPVFGGNPRAMTLSPNGRELYVAFALSGNRTTVVRSALAPPPPPPDNPALPAAPQVSLIVDALNPVWQPIIRYSLPDNDVAVIDTVQMTVKRYHSRVGTINLGIAVRPTTGDLYVTNTEALNLVSFEPNVRGHFVDNRVTRIRTSGEITAFDLNPGINYAVLPNPEARATALAQPAGIVFHPSGAHLYIAAFGTDRVAKVDPQGNVQSRIEIGPATGSQVDSRTKRGPRGLALLGAANRLYVLNRISNTISVIDTEIESVLGEFRTGAFDPTPEAIRNGRGFLYDAKLSGNGTASCASCHVDAEMDKLAWNLGDPSGDMHTVVSGTDEFEMHPMKGPMTTQTLRGLADLTPLHWRGDRADFNAFNPAFDGLMGGTPLSDPDMAAYTAFINTVRLHPNPHQNLDRTLPASINGGNPQVGRTLFLNMDVVGLGTLTCNNCHASNPGPGTNRKVLLRRDFTQPLKVPHLRNVYQKLNFNSEEGASSIDGFGLSHDGTESSIAKLIFGAFPEIRSEGVLRHLAAFITCFDTGTAPTVGYTRTVTPANVTSAAVTADWTLLEQQAAAGNIGLIAKGTVNGALRGLVYDPAAAEYIADSAALGPFTRTTLNTLIRTQGDTLSFMGVSPGTGIRMGIDRDADGVLDGDDAVAR